MSIRCVLSDLRPLAVSIVEPGSGDLRLFNCLLNRYHYLGHRNTVGENMRYYSFFAQALAKGQVAEQSAFESPSAAVTFSSLDSGAIVTRIFKILSGVVLPGSNVTKNSGFGVGIGVPESN